MSAIRIINRRAFQPAAADSSAAAAAGSSSGSCSGWRGMKLSSCVSEGLRPRGQLDEARDF